eukprot:4275843-Pyramimonas_sp.AAC.1
MMKPAAATTMKAACLLLPSSYQHSSRQSCRLGKSWPRRPCAPRTTQIPARMSRASGPSVATPRLVAGFWPCAAAAVNVIDVLTAMSHANSLWSDARSTCQQVLGNDWLADQLPELALSIPIPTS